VPAELAPLVAQALWLCLLAVMLVYIADDTPGEARTHGLVDDALDLIVPLLPLLATPAGRALCERITRALLRAGIATSM
jgi:hypothetical protein